MRFNALVCLLFFAWEALAVTTDGAAQTCVGASTTCTISGWDPNDTCELMVLGCSGWRSAGMNGTATWSQDSPGTFTEACESTSGSNTQTWLGYFVPSTLTSGTVTFTAGAGNDGVGCVVTCLDAVNDSTPVPETASPVDAASISISSLGTGAWAVGVLGSYNSNPTASDTEIGEADGTTYLYWANLAYDSASVTVSWTGSASPGACALEVADEATGSSVPAALFNQTGM